MNILLFDFAGNSVHLAALLKRQNTGVVDEVYVCSNSLCPEVWESYGVSIIPEFKSVDRVLEFVQRRDVELALNFSKRWAELGLIESLLEKKIVCFGTHPRFLESEQSQLQFKRSMGSAGLKTPEVFFEAKKEEILSKASELSYPVVVKSAFDVGPFTRVIKSSEDLKRYFRRFSRRNPVIGESMPFATEQFIDIDFVMGLYYLSVGDTALPIFLTREQHVDKSVQNAVGIVDLEAEPELAYKFDLVISDYLKFITQYTEIPCVGFAQIAIDRAGDAWVLENNARLPGSAFAFILGDSPLDIIRMALLGRTDALKTHFAGRLDSCFGLVAPLISNTRRLRVSAAQFEALLGVTGFLPIGFRATERGEYEQRYGGNISVFGYFDSSRARAHTGFSALKAQISHILAN